MSVPALARVCCVSGPIGFAISLPVSFTGMPAGAAGKIYAAVGISGLVIFLIATLALWVLDVMMLVEGWRSRDVAQNIAGICVLLIPFFGAYVTYFLLRSSNKPKDDGLKLA